MSIAQIGQFVDYGFLDRTGAAKTAPAMVTAIAADNTAELMVFYTEDEFVPSLRTTRAVVGVPYNNVEADPNTWALNPGYPLPQLVGSQAFDPPSLAANAKATVAVTVGGAAVGDFCEGVFDQATADGWVQQAIVTAPNTVHFTLINLTGGTLDLPAGVVRVRVGKQFTR